MQNEKVIINGSDGGFLDVLVITAENLKLLVLGSFLTGMLALGVSFVVPETFTSEAILVLPTIATSASPLQSAVPAAQTAAMIVSPLVLDPVVQLLAISDGQSIESARKKLRSRVKTVVGKDGLLRLETTATSPKEAQVLANVILDTWLKSTVPGLDERAELEVRLAQVNSSLENVERMLKRLTSEGVVDLNRPLTRGEVGASILAVAELQTRYLNEALTLRRILKGYSRDVVKQLPTLPIEAVAPRKVFISVLVTLGTGLTLFIWIFSRHAWRKSSTDINIACKQDRLLTAIGIKLPKLK